MLRPEDELNCEAICLPTTHQEQLEELEKSGYIFVGRTQSFDASRELINGNIGHVNDVTRSTMVVSHQGIEGPDAILPRFWFLALHNFEECSLHELGCGGRLPEPVRVRRVLAAVGRLQTSRAHAESLKVLLQGSQQLRVFRLLNVAFLLFGGLRFRPQFATHLDGNLGGRQVSQFVSPLTRDSYLVPEVPICHDHLLSFTKDISCAWKSFRFQSRLRPYYAIFITRFSQPFPLRRIVSGNL